jgi:hypothetical protein
MTNRLKRALAPPELSDAPVLLLGLVGFCGLAIGWLIGILLGHVLHVPAARPADGIISPIVLSHYSKPQELWLYLLTLLASGAAVALVFAEWRWYTGKLAEAGARSAIVPWVAAATLFVAALVAVMCLPGGAIFTSTLVLPAVIVTAAAVQGLTWFAFRRWSASPQIEHLAGIDALLPDAVPLPAFIADYAALAQHFAVLMSGITFGCYLPFALGANDTADRVAGVWFIWPLAAIACYAFVRRGLISSGLPESNASSRALYPFLPSLGLLAMPLLWASSDARAALLLGVVAATVALSIAAITLRLPALPRRAVLLVCGIFVAGYFGASVLLQNPTFLPGAYVSPFDGENFYSWMSDGTFGRVPFRDFFWPYGPLMFYGELLFVKLVRLDSYQTAYQATLLFSATLCAFYVMAYMLRGRLTALLAAPLLLVMYGAVQLRVWLGCVTVVTILWGLERGSRRILALAGMVCIATILYSPEVGIAAMLTSGACIIWYSFGLRHERGAPTFTYTAGWFAIGAAAVLVPAAAVGLATHALVPYFVKTAQFLSIADACCSTPFPPLFVGSALKVVPGFDVLWLFRDETFLTFYAPPLILTISIAYVAVRVMIRRRVERQDAALAAITLFAIIIFRSALGRSGIGHSQFAMLPTMIVALYLSERALFAALHSLLAVYSAVRGRRCTPLVLNILEASALFAFAFLLLVTIFRAPAPAKSWILGTFQNVHAYYRIERALPTVIPVRPGWRPIRSMDGEIFFFRDPNAAEMDPVLAFLKSTLGPTDNLCGIPFISRYQFMIHRPSAVPLGCDTWGLGEMPAWRRALIAELKDANPRYLIYNDADWPDPDGIPWMDREPELAAYYFDHYHIAKRIGRTTIYERGAPTPPSWIDAASPESAPFLRAGWYEMETNPLGSFRWTTQSATALLRQLPGQQTFALEAQIIAPQASGAPPQTLTVAVGGRPIVTTPLPAGVQEVEHLRVPVGAVRRPTTLTVSFALSNGFTAATDPRVLGIPIVRFGFAQGQPPNVAERSFHGGEPAAQRQAAAAASQAPARAVSAASAAPAASPAPLIPVTPGLQTDNVPAGLAPYRQELQGLFPAPPPGCCWISGRNRFMVRIPPKAKQVALTITVPQNAYSAGDEGISASFNGEKEASRHMLPLGLQTVTFEIPGKVKAGRNELDLVLDKTFVPAELHINSDTTHYGVLLHRVDFK